MDSFPKGPTAIPPRSNQPYLRRAENPPTNGANLVFSFWVKRWRFVCETQNPEITSGHARRPVQSHCQGSQRSQADTSVPLTSRF